MKQKKCDEKLKTHTETEKHAERERETETDHNSKLLIVALNKQIQGLQGQRKQWLWKEEEKKNWENCRLIVGTIRKGFSTFRINHLNFDLK